MSTEIEQIKIKDEKQKNKKKEFFTECSIWEFIVIFVISIVIVTTLYFFALCIVIMIALYFLYKYLKDPTILSFLDFGLFNCK